MMSTEDLKRARDEKGQYIGDDPFTEANEAWVKNKKTIMDLVKEFVGTKKRRSFFKWLTDK
jgi:hypothetical protein|tara:strand:+ start:562 stop:744 length:183 start_codon:yes stop_codon:yes gene_type:complete